MTDGAAFREGDILPFQCCCALELLAPARIRFLQVLGKVLLPDYDMPIACWFCARRSHLFGCSPMELAVLREGLCPRPSAVRAGIDGPSIGDEELLNIDIVLRTKWSDALGLLRQSP